MAPVSVQALLADPVWFPAELDVERGVLVFVRVDRDTIASRPRLDERWDRTALERAEIPLRELAQRSPVDGVELDFIWHTGFCDVDLPAVLDVSGQRLVLREPAAMTGLADMKRRGARGASFDELVVRVLGLLARPFSDGARALVVAPAASNALAGDVARLTAGKSLFLYGDCRSFVAAVARRGETGGGRIRRLFRRIAADGHEQARWRADALFEMSDLQIASVVWHMQIAELDRGMRQFGSARAVSLRSDILRSDARRTLEAVAAFFGCTTTTARPESSADDGASIDPRRMRDIDAVVAWSEGACRTVLQDTYLARTRLALPDS